MPVQRQLRKGLFGQAASGAYHFVVIVRDRGNGSYTTLGRGFGSGQSRRNQLLNDIRRSVESCMRSLGNSRQAGGGGGWSSFLSFRGKLAS